MHSQPVTISLKHHLLIRFFHLNAFLLLLITYPLLGQTQQVISGTDNPTLYEKASVSSTSDHSTFSITIAPNNLTGDSLQAETAYLACDLTTGLSEDVGSYKATLKWNHFNTRSYNIQWRAVGTTDWQTTSGVCCSEFTIYNLEKGRTYEWQIQKYCYDVTLSDFTPSRQFTTTCSATNIIYGESPTSNTIKLQWTGNRYYTYNLRYRPTTNPSNWSVITGIEAPNPENVYTLKNLTGYTTYEIQLQTACDRNDVSTFTSSYTTTTSCRIPSVLEVSSSLNQATFYWIAEPDVKYSIFYRSGNSVPFLSISNLTTSPFNLTGLSPNQLYQSFIQINCSDSSSARTNFVNFSTICKAPSYGYQKKTFVIAWQSLGSGLLYEVQYRQSGQSTWTNSMTTTVAETSLPGLNPNTQYEWRVRVQCNRQTSSDWSQVFTMRTGSCNPPVSLNAYFVEGGATVLDWNTWEDEKYILQWRSQGQSEWVTDTIEGDHYYLTGLMAGKTYEWRVASRCGRDMISAFSTIRTFTTECSNRFLPIGISYATNNDAEIYWSGLPGVRYQIHWRKRGTNDWNVSKYVSPGYIGDAFYKLSGLSPNTAYEARVQAFCSDGSTSSFSETQTFVTQCGYIGYARELVKTPTSISIWWGGPETGTSYTIRWGRSMFSQSWSGSATVNTNRYTIKGLSPFKTYAIEVKFDCSGSQPFYLTTDTNTECGFFKPANTISSLSSTSLAMTLSDSAIGFDTKIYYLSLNRSRSDAQPISIKKAPTASISGLTPNDMYLVQLLPDRSGCQELQSIVYVLPPSLTRSATIYSVANGNWDNPDTWSARRIPDKTDTVGIRHTVTIPDNTTGTAEYILYYKAGRIIQKSGARLQTGY